VTLTEKSITILAGSSGLTPSGCYCMQYGWLVWCHSEPSMRVDKFQMYTRSEQFAISTVLHSKHDLDTLTNWSAKSRTDGRKQNFWCCDQRGPQEMDQGVPRPEHCRSTLHPQPMHWWNANGASKTLVHIVSCLIWEISMPPSLNLTATLWFRNYVDSVINNTYVAIIKSNEKKQANGIHKPKEPDTIHSFNLYLPLP